MANIRGPNPVHVNSKFLNYAEYITPSVGETKRKLTKRMRRAPQVAL